MNKLNKYAIFGFILILTILAGYSYYLNNKWHSTTIKLDQTTQQLKKNIEINNQQQHIIATLAQQNELARQYVNQVSALKQQNEQAIEQLQQQFKRKQNDNKTIRDWSYQPLPDGLY